MKLTLRPNERETRKRVLENNYFWVFAQLYFKRTPSHLFSQILCVFSTNSCFTNILKATIYVFLTVAVLKAVENLLRYISTEAHLDLFLKEFRLTFRLNSYSNWNTAVKDTTCSSVLYTFPYFYDKGIENADIGSGPGTK